MKIEDTHLMPTHQPLPVTVARAEGVWVWDTADKAYLDTYSGLAVCPLGHTHPRVLETIQKQAAQYIHTSNTLWHPHSVALAEKLCDLTGLDKVFFGNSGAEACEAALKLARLYGHKRGINNPQVIVFDQSFHGRSLATLSATGFRWAQAGFEPLVSGFIRAPLNDIEALERIALASSEVVAVCIETIQGAAGVRPLTPGFLKALRAFCNANGYLLILDEIQSGLGRSGTFLAAEQDGVLPDIALLAKGLANGIPIGACLATAEIGNLMTQGRHGSTFGGNPLACAVACTVLDVIESEGLMLKAKEKGETLMDALKDQLSSHSAFLEVRGKGLMIGVEWKESANSLPKHALEEGLLLNVTNKSTLRFLPALTITQTEIELLIQKLSKALQSWPPAS